MFTVSENLTQTFKTMVLTIPNLDRYTNVLSGTMSQKHKRRDHAFFSKFNIPTILALTGCCSSSVQKRITWQIMFGSCTTCNKIYAASPEIWQTAVES